MGAEYFLISPFLDKRTQIPISGEEYLELKRAKKFITDYISYEESLFQLLKTYTELEKYLLSSGLEFLHFPDADWDFFQDIRIDANIRVASVLNAITSIRDQAPKLAHSQIGTTLRARLWALWEEERTESTAFSFAERFRNYAQHQTQPISRTSTGGGWDRSRVLCEHHTSIYVETLEVCNNRDIKAAERERYLTEYGDLVDVAGVLRETLSSIGRITDTLRADFEQPLNDSIEKYDHFLGIEGLRPQHYDVVSLSPDNETNFSIFPGLSDRAKKLRKQRYLKNYEKHYVSNRVRGHSSSPSVKPNFGSD